MKNTVACGFSLHTTLISALRLRHNQNLFESGDKEMILHIDDHTEIDTERDLCSEEKHILQKLLCYKVFVTSMEEFHEKTQKAFRVGWNNSGPVRESPALTKIIKQLEKEVRHRLATATPED